MEQVVVRAAAGAEPVHTARPCSQASRRRHFIRLPQQHMRQEVPLSMFQVGKPRPREVTNNAQITQLVEGSTRIQSQAVWLKRRSV